MHISLHYLVLNAIPVIPRTLGQSTFLMVPYFMDCFVLVKECDTSGETRNLPLHAPTLNILLGLMNGLHQK